MSEDPSGRPRRPIQTGTSSLHRRTFLSQGAAWLAMLLAGCRARSRANSTSMLGKRVAVVGAGPAGMTAAHLLRQHGVEVVILEAASTHGGRIKHDVEFTDFPISLGAEWVHVEPDILEEIVNDPSVEVATRLVAYDPKDLAGYYDGELSLEPIGDYLDYKFVGSSWLDFFDEYVVPGIADTMVFDTQVATIDYAEDMVHLTDARGVSYSADRVIVTVPLKVLQRGDIVFRPVLPSSRAKAIEKANVWSGLKVFLEFRQKFYPAALSFPDTETRRGQRLYYDAAYGQDTQANILGLFAVGQQAEEYQALGEEGLLNRILSELDEVFDGAASDTYMRHLAQNWNDERFIGAAYLAEVASWRTSRQLSGSVGDRVFFAGDAYTSFDDWGSVHCAVRSAAESVTNLLS